MDLAKEFNLAATSISNWVRAADKRDAALTARATPSAAGRGEPSRTRRRSGVSRRNWRARSQELEILGKALAFFARRADQ